MECLLNKNFGEPKLEEHLNENLGEVKPKFEKHLNENVGELKPKQHSLETTSVFKRRIELCGLVKYLKRSFRDVEPIHRFTQGFLRATGLFSKAIWHFIQGQSPVECAEPEEVKAEGYSICADELGSIVGARDANKLKLHGGVAGIAEKLCTSTTNGLGADTVLLKHRQEIYGINKFAEREVQSFWALVWEAVQDITLMIDASCAFVSLIVGIIMEGWQKGAHDAIVIAASISLAVLVTATNVYWQSLQFRDWDKEKKKLMVKVTRAGFRQKLLSSDLLPGDIVHLATGDLVPADGLFISGFSLSIDESRLTGETTPLMVNADYPFLLSGTKVLDGACKMMVTAIGMRTEWAKLMEILSGGGDDETPLQMKLNGMGSLVWKIGLFFAVATFAILVLGLFSQKWQAGTHWSWLWYDVLEMFKYFTIAYTSFVVTVPQGLPLAMSLNLAFAMKMLNNKALVRHMAAYENMGSAANICVEKTGTVTANHMAVVKSCICMNVKEASKHGNASSSGPDIPDSALKLLLQALFNNTVGEIIVNKDGELESLGTPTEIALLEFGLSLGGDFQAERQAVKLVKPESFNSTWKRTGVVLELPEGGLRYHCKGALEIVLAACDKVINSNGEVIPLDEAFINHLKVIINQFEDEALQTLCLAYMDLEDGFSTENPIPCSGYTCLGIMGFKDPICPGVKESVADCHSAGITVRMFTHDNMKTAMTIARECGILTDAGVAIEGLDFQEKSVQELFEMIPKIQVIAQSSPMDKHIMVKHLQTLCGEVVAVTGAEPNDVPSLLEADIGLVLGVCGTEVAKESADVIILDDNFSTIVTVVKWGRSIFLNIQKYVQFQLTVNVVALVVNISSACLTGNAPFSDVELLWVTLITDTLGAFALMTEPPNGTLMKFSPVGRNGRFISNVMWRNIFGQFFYQVIIIQYFQAKGKAILHLDGPNSDKILDTFIFNSFIFCQVSNLISSRKMEEKNVFQGVLDNHIFVAVLCCIVLFQITIIEFLGPFANTSPLTLAQWLLSISIGFSGIPVAAGVKMVPV